MRNSLVQCVCGLLAVLGLIFVPVEAGAQAASGGTPFQRRSARFRSLRNPIRK